MTAEYIFWIIGFLFVISLLAYDIWKINKIPVQSITMVGNWKCTEWDN